MAGEQTQAAPASSAASAPSSLPADPQSKPAASTAAPATASSPQTPNSSPSAPATAQPAAPEWKRPAYIPETITTEADTDKYVRELTAFKATEDSRRLTLPQKAEDFKLELPKDFKPPQGIEFVPNENDPILPQAKAFALKHGLSQDAFSELLSLKAAVDIGSQQNIDNAKAAEVGKLGVNGTARKTAVDTWLVAQLGEDMGKELSKFTFTAKQVEGFEALMSKARTQGVGVLSQQHRDPETPGKVSDAEYEKMSFGEKRAYAAKFGNPTAPAPQQANGR